MKPGSDETTHVPEIPSHPFIRQQGRRARVGVPLGTTSACGNALSESLPLCLSSRHSLSHEVAPAESRESTPSNRPLSPVYWLDHDRRAYPGIQTKPTEIGERSLSMYKHRLRSSGAAQGAPSDGSDDHGDKTSASLDASARRASDPQEAGAGGTTVDASLRSRNSSERGRPRKSGRGRAASPRSREMQEAGDAAGAVDGRGPPAASAGSLHSLHEVTTVREDSAEVLAKPFTGNEIVKGLRPVLCSRSTSTALPIEFIGSDGGHWVVDRTPYLMEASKLAAGRAYVLTRPRRFGKTTFIRMLREYWDSAIPDDEYAASMAEFWIAQHKERWRGRGEYMVWVGTLPASVSDLELEVICGNRAFATRYGLALPDPVTDMDQLFASARALHPTRRIAVLVDEYDAVINNSIQISEAVIDFTPGVCSCTSFFNRIKKLLDTRVIDVAFLTGLTPIAIHLFGSNFNCVADLTRDTDFAYVCGFFDSDVAAGLGIALKRHSSTAELEDRVKAELQRMKRAFNGYRFAPESLYLASLYNSTCVTHYLTQLTKAGIVRPDQVSPRTVSLSDHAADVIGAMSSHVDLLTDLLLNDRSVSLESGYITTRRVSLDSISSRAVGAALLFYHGAATLRPVAGSTDLECPNESIAIDFLQRIRANISELPELHAAARALARDGDAAAFINAVFRNETLIRVSETDGRLSEAALRLRLFCAFVSAVPEAYHVLTAETSLGVHTALTSPLGNPGTADLLVVGKVLIELKVATHVVANAIRRIRSGGRDCSFQTLLQEASAFREAIRIAAAQAANYKVEGGVRKFVCLALDRETAYTIELDPGAAVECLMEPDCDISINEEGRLVGKRARKGRSSSHRKSR